MALPGKIAPPRLGLNNWLTFGFLGLAAIVAGVTLPRTLPGPGGPTADLPSPPAVPSPAAKAPPTPTEGLAYSPPTLPEAPSPQAMLSRLAFGMGVVIVTCFGMVWACKRWLKTGTLPGEVGSQLRVVERLMLGPRCSVFLLQSGRCRVLAGVDGSGLQALVPLSEPFEDALTEAGETPSDAAAP